MLKGTRESTNGSISLVHLFSGGIVLRAFPKQLEMPQHKLQVLPPPTGPKTTLRLGQFKTNTKLSDVSPRPAPNCVGGGAIRQPTEQARIWIPCLGSPACGLPQTMFVAPGGAHLTPNCHMCKCCLFMFPRNMIYVYHVNRGSLYIFRRKG